MALKLAWEGDPIADAYSAWVAGLELSVERDQSRGNMYVAHASESGQGISVDLCATNADDALREAERWLLVNALLRRHHAQRLIDALEGKA